MKNILIFTIICLSLIISVSAQIKSDNPHKQMQAARLPPTDSSKKVNSGDQNQLFDNGTARQSEILAINPFEKEKSVRAEKKDFENELKSARADADNSDEYNKFELFTGYSGASLSGESVENGFEIAGVFNFRRFVGVKIDLTGTFKSYNGNFITFQTPDGFGNTLGTFTADHSLYNITGGVQFKDNAPTKRLKPFAHFLVGYGKHSDSVKEPCPPTAQCPPSGADFNFGGTSFVIGGGFDIKLNRLIDVRVIQGDLNPIVYSSARSSLNTKQTSIYNNFRFGTGIVFKF